MAYIRKRKRSGKVRWQVVQEIYSGKKRTQESETFDSHAEAKAKLGALLNSRPKATALFTVLADHFLKHYEKLVAKGERERSTLEQLRQHLNLYILTDDIATLKCGAIGTPEAQLFLDRLIDRVSPEMATKIKGTLSNVFAHGARRGFIVANPIASTKLQRRTRPDAGEAEHFVLPSKQKLHDLLRTAEWYGKPAQACAVVRVLMFSGLRISELRGLRREDITLTEGVPNLKIVQRADQFGKIGSVKASASRRTIELGPLTSQVLTRWLEKAKGELVFATDTGEVWSYANFWHRFWVPLMNKAECVTKEPASATVRNWSKAQADFKQPLFGPHMLRHVYASLQIEQGVTPKRLQYLMGHGTLKLTLDTYGHLWPDESADRARARAVENSL